MFDQAQQVQRLVSLRLLAIGEIQDQKVDNPPRKVANVRERSASSSLYFEVNLTNGVDRRKPALRISSRLQSPTQLRPWLELVAELS
ncbi:MAG: hypothetical protein LAO78_10320 [Acidobacteriia bacterium]|nr:hypothetical protein [Terriglobia bacterium]